MITRNIIDQYNVIWYTPSRNSSGSMPLGNGDIGLNCWVEEDGDILIYLAKSDAFDNNHRPIKLGRIRVKLSHNFFIKGATFLQTLNLYEGEIQISVGGGEEALRIVIWADANDSVVHIEAEGGHPFGMAVILETWRTERPLNEAESFCAKPPLYQYEDTILNRNNGLMWYYRNQNTDDTSLINRTSGAFIKAKGFANESDIKIVSQSPNTKFHIRVYPLVSQSPTPEGWVAQLDEIAAKKDDMPLKEAYLAHKQWWAAFWERSHIHITGAKDAATVSQGYILQRFMCACSGRADVPIRFNGALFTVDVYKEDCDDTALDDSFLEFREREIGQNPDFRRWGGFMWWQNIRLVYWPLLAAGDYDMLRSFFKIYTKVLPDAKQALKKTMGYENAAAFNELAEMEKASYKDTVEDDAEGFFITHVYYQILELALMMLDYCEYTRDTEYLIKEAIPMAHAGICFYDQHFKRDESGKLFLSPVNACETYWKASNPANEIAGLKYLIARLFALNQIDQAQKAVWERIYNELPPLPMRDIDGKQIIVPANVYGERMNKENPELYAIFPFRIYGVGKPDLDIAKATFENRIKKIAGCWSQDAIDAAYIGEAKMAQEYVTTNFSRKNPSSRFPAFWVAGNDWVPDMDNGGVGMMALQAMLMQAEGDTIHLFPAWPKDWDVEFKLNAPYKTIVEGSYVNGRLTSLKVTPIQREKDVIIHE